MCGGAKYIEPTGKEWNVYFPSPKAALPIVRPDGVEWIKWGKRREETAPGFAQGGWARIDSVNNGKWDKYNHKRVYLAIQAFMEKDAAKKSHWVAVPPGMAVDGLVITINDESRLYVVTEDTPPEYAWVHDRWPRLVPAQAGGY